MKNKFELSLIKIMVFCFCVFTCFETQSAIGRKTRIDVKFGNGSHNCKGFGICLIYDPFGPDPAAFSILSMEKELVKIEIPYSKVKESPGLFEGDYFIMEESYEIPIEICKKIGIEIPLVLAKGKHRIFQGSEGLLIQFAIEK